MTRTTRIGLAVLALALLAVLRTPLWHIELVAPQYPEGLGMYIWADQITGQKPNDLNSINGLNHYIGMKEIRPEAIPELRFMPWVILGLTLTGLGVAATGRRSLLYVWTGIFLIAGLVGLVDFYLWGYDYGHDLNPMAAIKVPGMSYQPPLIGSKNLLNFKAVSWPALGGVIALLALAGSVALCLLEFRRPRRQREPMATAAPTPELSAEGSH